MLLPSETSGYPFGETIMVDTRWEDARRLEAWAGEVRVNLIRAVALALFYANHLLNVYIFDDDLASRGQFHVAVTAVVLAWASGILVLYACLSRRWMPASLKYVVTAWDLLLITLLVILSSSGPRSPMMLLYFVVLASAPLRLSLPLIWFSTVGSTLCGLIVLGQYIFFRVGWDAYFDPERGLHIPRVAEILFLLALAAVGLLTGQMVRQAHRLVQGYPLQVEEPKEAV